jgi:hypothetical protein
MAEGSKAAPVRTRATFQGRDRRTLQPAAAAGQRVMRAGPSSYDRRSQAALGQQCEVDDPASAGHLAPTSSVALCPPASSSG